MKKIFVVIFSTLLAFGAIANLNITPAFADVGQEQPAAQITLTKEQLKALNDLKSRMFSELSPQVPNLSEHVEMINTIYGGGSATPEQINAFKEEIKSSNVKINTNYEQELNRILTPEQRAMYRQMKSDLEKQLNRELQK